MLIIFNVILLAICIETKVVYKSATDAGRKLKIDNKTISACCRGDNKEAGGFHWMFENEYSEENALIWLENAKSKKYKEVYCIDTDKTYNSIVEASIDTGVSAKMIGYCCSGNALYAGGLMWLYLNDVTEEKINYMINQKKIIEDEKLGKRVICLETKEIYQSSNDAENKTGISKDQIRECCKGNGITAKGYHWMYMSDYTEEYAAKVLNKPKSIRAKRVKCLETGVVYESIRMAALACGSSNNVISKCCKGEYSYAGKLPDGTKLHWEYVTA